MNSRRVVNGALLGVLPILLLAGAAAARPPASPRFTPANVAHASDIPIPMNTMAVGVTSLLLSLDANGQVQNVQIERNFPGVTNIVRSAVQNWTYSPAMARGSAVPTSFYVSAVLNPYNPGGTGFSPLELDPPQFTPTADSSGFVPPTINSASWALYPSNTTAWGTVVLSVRVGVSGQVTQAHVVHGVPGLNQAAIQAVKTWSFNSATLHGNPIAAAIAIAFIFPRNTL